MPPLLYRLRRLEREAGDAGADLRSQRREGSRRGQACPQPRRRLSLRDRPPTCGSWLLQRTSDSSRTRPSDDGDPCQREGRVHEGQTRHALLVHMHCPYMTTYRMYRGRDRELRFPLAVSVSYQNSDRDKHGGVVRGYVACDLVDRTPTQVERRYRKRLTIETSYRLFRQTRATTTTQDPMIRFAFVIVSFLLENL